MSQCKHCSSFAINPHMHGRTPGVDLDHCDVCYWRVRVPVVEQPDLERIAKTDAELSALHDKLGGHTHQPTFNELKLGKLK